MPYDQDGVSSADADMYTLALQDTSDPEVRLRLLSYRVSVLTREKEKLEARVAKMEKSFNMGAGVLLLVPFIGAAIGLLIGSGRAILRPWMGP